MAAATDVISTQRLRNAVGAVGDESDTLLSGLRDSAIDYLERYTGRCIVDRTDWTSDPDDFNWSPLGYPDFLMFTVSDIKAGDIVLKYATGEPKGRATETMTIATTDGRVNLTRDRLVLYSAEGASTWSETMRFNHPVPTITVDRGMAAADIPKSWADATALIVRALMDGSAYDDLGSNTALQLLLRPFRQTVYGLTAR